MRRQLDCLIISTMPNGALRQSHGHQARRNILLVNEIPELVARSRPSRRPPRTISFHIDLGPRKERQRGRRGRESENLCRGIRWRRKQGQVGQRCVLFEWILFMNEWFLRINFFLWMHVFFYEWINDSINELLNICYIYWVRTTLLLKKCMIFMFKWCLNDV